jgi:hypothetical protein
MAIRRISGFIALLSLAAAGGCDQSAVRESAPQAQEEAESTTSLRLPVSLNEVMVALVNQSADPIWRAAWRNPESDRDWRNLERMAYQLQLAGALLEIPGNGRRDVEWTSNPQWSKWANQLEDAGERAVKAVAARDIERISRSGDEIVDICEGCHIDFKPDKPTSGMFGELSPTAEDFEESEREH